MDLCFEIGCRQGIEAGEIVEIEEKGGMVQLTEKGKLCASRSRHGGHHPDEGIVGIIVSGKSKELKHDQRRRSPSDPLPEPDDPPADVEYLKPSRQRNRRDAARPYVSVISDGEALAVYPDDETVRAWDEEGWKIVRAGFARGDRQELVLTKSPDDFGIGIRRYRRQRVSVHVGINSKGRARQPAPSGAVATPSSSTSPSKSS